MNEALYQRRSGPQPTATGLAPCAHGDHFSIRRPNGVDAVKTFRFDSSYVFSVETK